MEILDILLSPEQNVGHGEIIMLIIYMFVCCYFIEFSSESSICANDSRPYKVFYLYFLGYSLIWYTGILYIDQGRQAPWYLYNNKKWNIFKSTSLCYCWVDLLLFHILYRNNIKAIIKNYKILDIFVKSVT